MRQCCGDRLAFACDLADSDVPGTGTPLRPTVPVSVWTYEWDSYWRLRDLVEIGQNPGIQLTWLTHSFVVAMEVADLQLRCNKF